MSVQQLSHRAVKHTRKERACDWCGEAIPAGSPAMNDASIYDGRFQNRYTHPECFYAMEATDWYGLGTNEYLPGTQPRGTPMTEETLS